MSCLNTRELEKLLRTGAMDESIAAYEHVCSCEQCAAELRKLAGRSRAAVDIAEAVLGTYECPEYDALSAFVEGSLDPNAASTMQAHLNSCDLCSRDVERISELRAAASLREVVEVRPGLGRVSKRAPLLRRVLSGLALAGAAAAVVFALLPAAKEPVQKPEFVAVAPENASKPAPPTSPEITRPHSVAPEAAAPIKQPQPAAKPAYKIVLVDGRYRIAKLDGKLVVLKNGGRVDIPQGLMTRIAQRVSTGRVTISQPIAVAMSSIRVRADEGYVPPPTAPKLVEPVGKIVLSDQPVLRWGEVQLAHSYRVTIRDAEGNTVYDDTTTNAQAVSARLTRGQVYTWQVAVKFNENDQWAQSRAARFRVVSDSDMSLVRQVSRSMPGSHLALGAVYESLGLKDEAANEYTMLRRANPRF